MTANILGAARTAGARLVFPGNVYGYGPLQQVPATEEHPLGATTRKGLLRNALEGTLWDAHERGELPVVIPRFPDFYGPNVWNTPGYLVFARVAAGKTARWPGRLDVLHDLVSIDDAAAAAVLLGSTGAASGRVWHVPGAGPLTGRELIELACAAAAEPVRMQAVGAFLLRLAGLFDPNPRELVELLYEWEEPLVLDGSRLAQAFPSFSYTPHEEAVRRTVEWFTVARRA
jgi:nucleoside-diphosphate-sugar epimerase